MKKLVLGIFLAASMLLPGCFSYKDINRMAFVTAIIIDVNEKGDPAVYAEVFRPYRSESDASGKGQRLVYHADGENLDEALRIMQLGSSQRLNFTQNKAIIFTKRATEKGIDFFIDFLNRNQEFLLRQFMFVIDTDPAKFMESELSEEPYIGIFLSDICLTRENYAKLHIIRIDEYLTERLVGSEVSLIPFINVNNTTFDNRVSLSGAVVIQNDKFKCMVEVGETREYNIMMNIAHKGILDIKYDDTDNHMAFEILKNKVTTHLTYDGKIITLRKKINLQLSFGETQKALHLNSAATRESIKAAVEQRMKFEMETLFEKWKTKGVDIFDIKRQFDRIYPNVELNTDNIIDISELELDIDVTLEGSTDVTNFIK